MKICVVHEFASQEKAAQQIVASLTGHTVVCSAIGNEADVLRFLRKKAFSYDLIILTVGGSTIRFFMAAFASFLAVRKTKSRPLVAAITVGVTLDRVFFGTFMYREAADIVFVDKRQDAARVIDVYSQIIRPGETVPMHKVLPCRCPIFPEIPSKIDYSAPVKTICFAAQTDIPSSREDRAYVAQRLVQYARRHPSRTVILKPKHRPGEKSAHPQRHPYETLVREACQGEMPNNLVLSYDPMIDVIEASDLVLSVSSTAIVEAMLSGKRCAVIADFGITEPFGTSYFLNSGIYATFDEIESDEIPVHNPEWLEEQIDAPSVSSVVNSLSDLVDQAKEGLLPLQGATLGRLESLQRWKYPAPTLSVQEWPRPKAPKGLVQKVTRAVKPMIPEKLRPRARSIAKYVGIV